MVSKRSQFPICQYLSELENEYYTLRGSGYNGEGFYSEGKRLGQGVSHNAPISQAKSKAAVAAEKRKAISGVMKGSGQRLGGPSRTQTKSPRELAAEVCTSELCRKSFSTYYF